MHMNAQWQATHLIIYSFLRFKIFNLEHPGHKIDDTSIVLA